MSLTNEVFPHPLSPRTIWVYYTIRKPDEFKRAEDQTTRPVVLMFLADWNEACKVMKKPFNDMAWARMKDAVFCLVDIDKLKKEDSTIVAKYRVEALPTFVLLKNGEVKERVVGNKKEEFQDMGRKIKI